MNLPNKLTILRIILVPVMVVIAMFDIPGDFLGIPTTFLILNLIFIIASITDNLDGKIARKNNLVTTFGKFADPLADKILVLAAMMILVEAGIIPAWIPIVTIIREFIVSGYRLIVVEKGGQVIAANIWGKLKTITQIIAIILAFISVDANGIHPFGEILKGTLIGIPFTINLAMTVFMALSVVAAIFSGVEYLKGSKDLFKSE